MADGFLVHNRPIVRHADDSIVRIIAGTGVVLRRARGIAPLPVPLPVPLPMPVLGTGAHLKNAVAIGRGRNCFVSQHIGDLGSVEAHDAFRSAARDLGRMFGTPGAVACDMHPDYLSTAFARETGLPLFPVQHHVAHVASCMAENGLDGRCLGVAWDGTGFGTDGTVWGGEFFVHEQGEFRRVATFTPFALPGGDQAVREPRRSALGMVAALGSREGMPDPLARVFTPEERERLLGMIASGFNSPQTTSAGRLFDGAASLLGLRQRNAFEGQAAMALEFAARGVDVPCGYPLDLGEQDGLLRLDWREGVLRMIREYCSGTSAGICAARFHAALAAALLEVARRTGLERVLLTGGCFQNDVLTGAAVAGLRKEGFRVYLQQRVPPNDGGIALGQVYAAALASGRRAASDNE